MLSLIAQVDDFGTTTDAAAAAAAGTAAVGIGVGMLIFWILFCGVGFVLWLWALIDVIKRQFPNQNDKILWLVLILLLGYIGPILYLLIGRKKGTIPGASAPAAK